MVSLYAIFNILFNFFNKLDFIIYQNMARIYHFPLTND